MDIQKMFLEADAMEPECIRIRRDFHKYPEMAWTEFRTTAVIVKFLRERGIEIHVGQEIVNPEFAWSYPGKEEIERQKERAVREGADAKIIEEMGDYTGAMAVIDSGKPGPVFGFRFDIDCNEVAETDVPDHRPNREGFASTHPGWMHACGHDGHATMGMILASILQEHKDELKGKVKIIFQPSEEGDKGAQSVVESGVLKDVDAICGMHIVPTKDPYPALAGSWHGLYATTKFTAEFSGKSAHAGAAPEEGHSAILAAAAAIMMMQGFLQDGRGSGRLNVGVIHGGTAKNVVPESCMIGAETRGSDTDVEKRLYEAACRCIKTAAEAYGCEVEISVKGYCPTGDGTTGFAKKIVEWTSIVPDLKGRKEIQPNTGGTDDFAYMMRYIQEQGKPACYMNLFTKLSAGLHNGAYDMDESCLKAGVKSCLAVLDGYLAEDSAMH
ncbi:MAG: amidohydrolase [Clostridium sp.]|nr:amidohydrolase [Clostridium sp.]